MVLKWFTGSHSFVWIASIAYVTGHNTINFLTKYAILHYAFDALGIVVRIQSVVSLAPYARLSVRTNQAIYLAVCRSLLKTTFVVLELGSEAFGACLGAIYDLNTITLRRPFEIGLN